MWLERREFLALGLAPHAFECDSVGFQNSPVQQIGGGGSGEDIATVFFRIGMTGVGFHSRPGGGKFLVVLPAALLDAGDPSREDPPGLPNFAPSFDGAGPVDGEPSLGQRVDLHGTRGQEPVQVEEEVGVPLQVSVRHDHVPAEGIPPGRRSG